MTAVAAEEEHQKELASSLSDSGASVEEGCPQLQDGEQQQQHGEEEDEDSAADEDASPGGARAKQGRSEKKARKAVQRHGLKHMPNITRVILRKNKHMLFTVAKPEVYKSTTSDTYVIFGEAKAEDLNSQAHSAAAQRFTQAPGMTVPMTYGGGEGSNSAAGGGGAAAAGGRRGFDGRMGGGDIGSGGGEEEGDDDGEEVDEEGISADDIQLVMTQVGCSRKRAVAALRLRNNDVVDAIIELSET